MKKLPKDREEIVEDIIFARYTDKELVKLIRDHLINTEDLEFLYERGWGILDIVYGWNTLSNDYGEALEESRRIQAMIDDWNRILGWEVFGYNGVDDTTKNAS